MTGDRTIRESSNEVDQYYVKDQHLIMTGELAALMELKPLTSSCEIVREDEYIPDQPKCTGHYSTRIETPKDTCDVVDPFSVHSI